MTAFNFATSLSNTNPTMMNVDPRASFPCRLHRMLCDIDQLARSDPSMAHLPNIVSWREDGRAFKVHDRKKFVDTVMPIWFSRLKYSSFVRGVSGHGFARLRCDGPDNGANFHHDFLRDQPQLACRIEKTKRKNRSDATATALNAVAQAVRRASETSSSSTASKSSHTSPLSPAFAAPAALNESLFGFMKQLPFPSWVGNQEYHPAVAPTAVWPTVLSTFAPAAERSMPLTSETYLSDKLCSLSQLASDNESMEDLLLADLDLPAEDFVCSSWEDLEPLPL